MKAKNIIIILAAIAGLLFASYSVIISKRDYIGGNVLNIPFLFENSTRASVFSPSWVSNGLVSSLLFRPLILANHDYSNYTPDLAQSFNVSEDGLKYSFILKAEQKWSDGETITVEDIVHTFERTMNSDNTDAGLVSSISAIETLEYFEDTITFTLKRPNRNFLKTVSGVIIIPHKILKENRVLNFSQNDYWKNPIVSGMYMVDKINPHESYELVQNPYYGGVKPKIEKIILHKNPRQSLDLYHTNSISEIMSLRAVRGLNEYPVPSYFMRYIGFNIENNDDKQDIVKNIDFRRAVEASIDPKSIFQTIYLNIGELHLQNPKAKTAVMGYDEALAKELLAKSNYDMTRPLRLITYYKRDNSLHIVQTVANQLREMGFIVEVKHADNIEEILARKDYDIFFKDYTGLTAEDRFSIFMPNQPLAKVFGESTELQNIVYSLKSSDTDAAYQDYSEQAAIALTDLHYRFPLFNLNQAIYINSTRVKLPKDMVFGNLSLINDLRFTEWEIKKD